MLVTGNDYLALPEIEPQGGIKSINVLSVRGNGLLEFLGGDDPFLSPYLKVGDEVYGEWEYLADWIPRMPVNTPGLNGEILCVCPPNEKGMVFIFRCFNKGRSSCRIEVGLKGVWHESGHTVYRRRPLPSGRGLLLDSWTGALVLEMRPALPLAAVALLAGAGDYRQDWQLTSPGKKVLDSGYRRVPPVGKIKFACRNEVVLAPGQAISWPVFLAVNLEVDGASTTAIHLQRLGAEYLLAQTEEWLAEHRLQLKDEALTVRANYNLIFNRFFACGRALEDEKLYLMTSRSPRYYVSAAYWPRDALLWSFPGLLVYDKERAREALLGVFARHWHQGGCHSQYINGTVLYPGFELDQLCSYFIALGRYLAEEGDLGLIQQLDGAGLVREFQQSLLAWKKENEALFATFLDPADDPPTYPYLTYNHVLVMAALKTVCLLQPNRKWEQLQNEILRNLQRYAMVKGPGGKKMLAWSFDGRGNHELYENPPGSLALLPYYGFLKPTDPVYVNTINWIRSSLNPYFNQGAFAGSGALHARGPWVLGAVACLLGGRGIEAMGRWLVTASLDGGLACETIDPETGKARTGLAFASCAGFLGYSLYYRFSRSKEAENG